MTSIILWSGGKDSTLLVWRRLKAGHLVKAVYITVDNNRDKAACELAAVDRMTKFLQSVFPNKLEVFKIANISLEGSGQGMILAQPILWLLPAAYFYTSLNQFVDEVCLGYVMNDDAISYLSEFKAIWEAMAALSSHGFPPLVFPLSKVKKGDEPLPVELEKCRVWCEAPRDSKPCGRCSKCVDEWALPTSEELVKFTSEELVANPPGDEDFVI